MTPSRLVPRSCAADAYLNEMGITSPLLPKENSSLGRPVDAFDTVPDPDDDGADVESFARFINRGAFTVPEALGDKIIHPFGDFLLHNVGTGDGVVQNGGPANKLRTAPLWGLRTACRRGDLRHRQPPGALSGAGKEQLFTFLKSL